MEVDRRADDLFEPRDQGDRFDRQLDVGGVRELVADAAGVLAGRAGRRAAPRARPARRWSCRAGRGARRRCTPCNRRRRSRRQPLCASDDCNVCLLPSAFPRAAGRSVRPSSRTSPGAAPRCRGRVAVDGDQIGEQPLSTRPMRSSRRKHAALPEVAATAPRAASCRSPPSARLAHVVAVRVDADVAAEAHRHAGASAALNAARLRAMRAGSGSTPFFQPAYCAVASPARKRRAERHVLLHHQLPDLGRAARRRARSSRRRPRWRAACPRACDACATTGRPLLLGRLDDARRSRRA